MYVCLGADVSPSMQEGETIVDTLVYGKIESYLRIIEDQLTDKTLQRYPEHLEVYARIALKEYACYMNMYSKWEREGGDVPRLVSLSNYKDTPGI
jgi:adenine-specific DNA methylase